MEEEDFSSLPIEEKLLHKVLIKFMASFVLMLFFSPGKLDSKLTKNSVGNSESLTLPRTIFSGTILNQ